MDIGTCSNEFLKTLETREATIIQKYQANYNNRYAMKNNPDWTNTILIHHKLPNNPFSIFQPSNRPKIIIARVMIESNILPRNEIQYLKNDIDYIWVPTSWHENIYVNHGINKNKLFVVNEPMSFKQFETKTNSATYRFLSVFKYEHRKGGDILLNSYWNAFTLKDDVELIIRSYRPSWLPGTKNLENIFKSIAKRNFGKLLSELAKVTWVKKELNRKEMFDLYKSASAFVLPTRGEGWCLPCVEAMSMGLPIVVTNFSGPTEYLNEKYSYPIPIHNNINHDGTAEPDSNACTNLMQHLYKNPAEGKEKGALASKFVAKHLSPNIIAKKILKKLHEYVSYDDEDKSEL